MNTVNFERLRHDVTAPFMDARSLHDALRSRTGETDQIARLPEATVEALDSAGMFKLLVPRANGGAQLDMLDYMDVIVELGRSDVSAAWVVNLINLSEWMFASIFPQDLQAEVFGSKNPRIASVLHPFKCVSHATDGGLFIEHAMWRFNSGIYHAGWDMLTVPLPGKEGEADDYGLAIFPVSDVQTLNDWDTAGIRGSGSTSVEIRNVFVPQERVHSMSAAIGGNVAARHGPDDYHYRQSISASAVLLSLPVLGGCDAAIEIFLQKIQGRRIQHSVYTDATKSPLVHLALGEASAKIDAAKLLTRDILQKMDLAGRNAAAIENWESATIRRNSGLVSQLAWEGVNQLAESSGASMMAHSHPLNRIWRDVRTGTLHAAHAPAINFENYGRMACGVDDGTWLG
jgi:3-hydroxy-9,10-secoandrosta-1,3,5(10)-triene-9,17-dione monooxygenase